MPVIVAAALLAGCAAGPEVEARAVPAATVRVLGVEQAARVYLEAVAEPNRLNADLDAELRRPVPRMGRVRDLGRRMQAADRRLLGVLSGTAWPERSRVAASELARVVAGDVARDGVIARARVVGDIPPPAGGQGAAELMRATLGLPVVPAPAPVP